MKIFRNKNKEIIKAIEVLNKVLETESKFIDAKYTGYTRDKINELIKKLDY